MKLQKKSYLNVVKKVAEKSLVRDANSTTCMAIHQPKAPKSLKKFSRIENDK